jgi:hypothetical protein
MKDKEQVLTSSGELNRMRILGRYELLRTLPENLFDDLMCLTATLLDVPIALISLMSAETEAMMRGSGGLGITFSDAGEEFGTAAIRHDETTVLEEMAPKPLELANPFVTRALSFRFYAATSLKGSNGENIGSLCVIGRRPRTFSPTEREVLSNLAGVAIRLLDLRQALGPDPATLSAMWNAVYTACHDSLHRSLALAERLNQQQDLETITAVIQRKLICKDANYIAASINQQINAALKVK